MAAPRLILILGDQLSPHLSSLAEGDPARDRVVMAEVAGECDYVPHHRKKIAFLFAAMRHFADRLRRDGWRVDYYTLDQDHQDLTDALLASRRDSGARQLLVTAPGEWRLLDAMKRQWPQKLGCTVRILDDRRFLCTSDAFRDWAEGRKQPRMEYFYRTMRRATGLLMDADGQPLGGRWNFDKENRKRFDGEAPPPGPKRFTPDATTREVLDLLEARFPDRFGDLQPFWFAVTEEQAQASLSHFLDHALPHFGDYQDAMDSGDDFLFHSVLSQYINAGLLDPLAVCEAAEQRYLQNKAPLNAVEGFIRQILGWREYVRGLYWLLMPDYREENRLVSHRDLPWFYWSGETRMRCVSEAVRATREHAYAHHIQRLMVTGNLALLLGVEVKQIHEWYLAVYADAYEWVELPNTLGMVMHADGGYLGSKPYAASGKYIQRMSDYCGDCPYKVSSAEEDNSCPFNSLYWHFIHRHRRRFEKHPRMSMIYKAWGRMAESKRDAILARADTLLEDPEHL